MRSLLFNIWFYAFTFLCAMITWIISYLMSVNAMRRLLQFWAKGVLWGAKWILGARLQIRGLDKLPAGGPTLIVSKHQSEMDAVVFLSLFPDLGAIAMQELENYPFVGRIIRRLSYILVSVENGPQNLTQQVVDGAVKVHAQGRPILIYPEGTLMSLGARERYRSGAFHIYDSLQAPATPVALSLGLCWPRREFHKRGGDCVVEFMDPVEPGLDRDAFMKQIEELIEDRTMALIAEYADPETLAQAEDRHKRGAANED